MSLGAAGWPFCLSINICCFGSVAFGLPTVVLCLQGTLRFSPAKLGARSSPEAQLASIADRIGDNSGVTHPLCFTLFCQEHTQHSFHGNRMACSDYPGIPPWSSHTIPPKATIISKSTELVPTSACYGSSNQAVIGWSCLQGNVNMFCTSFTTLFPCLETLQTNITQTRCVAARQEGKGWPRPMIQTHIDTQVTHLQLWKIDVCGSKYSFSITQSPYFAFALLALKVYFVLTLMTWHLSKALLDIHCMGIASVCHQEVIWNHLIRREDMIWVCLWL